jgi:hypothetical protein
MNSRYLFLGIFPLVVVACGGETVNVGSTSQMELQKKNDGSPTGNGQTCSWDDSVSSDGTTNASPDGAYNVGDEFAAPDGCNSCVCTKDGIACTNKACQSPPGGGGDDPPACTEEAKQCPDGSYVSRTGPNCEFAPCPGDKACDLVVCTLACENGFKKDANGCDICACEEAIACTQEAKLCPDGKTYVSRTGPNCEFAPCP